MKKAVSQLTFNPDITLLGELAVDERATTEEMVLAGEYNYTNEHITTANFPIISRGPRQLYLAHFKRDVETKEVKAAVAQMDDKEQASIGYLLAVGAHPTLRELQQKFPIICLGFSAMVEGHHVVPCLSGWSQQRRLHLGYYGRIWPRGFRFLLMNTSY